MNKTETVTLTGVGLAIGQIVVWALETFALTEPMPNEVAMAVGTVITGGLVLLAQFRRSKHETDNRLS